MLRLLTLQAIDHLKQINQAFEKLTNRNSVGMQQNQMRQDSLWFEMSLFSG